MSRPVSHCIYGHPKIGSNLYIRPNGRRECRECQRARAAARRAA